MPELPEVEVLARHLAPLLRGRQVLGVQILRAKVLRPTLLGEFKRRLLRSTFTGLSRRAKYLRFELKSPKGVHFCLLGHLGMTGRMFLSPVQEPIPRHAAIVLNLGLENFVYEDMRYFGRFTLDSSALESLGPEPWSKEFTVEYLADALRRSSQAVKVKLLDQTLVAGVGNIYASESLFRAKISPQTAARRLTLVEVRRLWQGIRATLSDAIERGSTMPLNYGGDSSGDRLFYFGRTPDSSDYREENLQVYGRLDEPCRRCNATVRRLIQCGRSTFYCPKCQPGG